MNTRYRYAECSSGCGKTMAGAKLAGYLACKCKSDEYIGWLAPKYITCRIGFRMLISELSEDARDYMYRTNSITSSDGNMRISFAKIMERMGQPGMGATVEYRSAEHPDTIYGGIYKYGFVDEASRCARPSRDAFLTTLNKGGIANKVWFWGNVTDRWNWFFEECREVEREQEHNDIANMRDHFAQLSWKDAIEAQMRDRNGRLLYFDDGTPMMVQTVEMIEDNRKKMSEADFLAAYENIPISEQGRPFTDEMIDNCAVVCQCETQQAWFRLCDVCHGISSSPAVKSAVDVAVGSDWNVHMSLDRFGRVCHYDRWQDTDLYRIVERVGKNVGEETIRPDITGVGRGFIDIWRRRWPEKAHQIKPGIWTNKTGPKWTHELIRAMQNREIQFPRGIIAEELAAIQAVPKTYGYKYEAVKEKNSGTKKNDDCFDALAMVTYLFSKDTEFSTTVHTVRKQNREIPRNIDFSGVGERTSRRMMMEMARVGGYRSIRE